VQCRDSHESGQVRHRDTGVDDLLVGVDPAGLAVDAQLGTHRAGSSAFERGVALVTAAGATMDERFRAFDRDTGKVLWEFQMDAGGYATPATFEADGRQYVVIAAGGGGKPETKPGDAYYCFALPR